MEASAGHLKNPPTSSGKSGLKPDHAGQRSEQIEAGGSPGSLAIEEFQGGVWPYGSGERRRRRPLFARRGESSIRRHSRQGSRGKRRPGPTLHMFGARPAANQGNVRAAGSTRTAPLSASGHAGAILATLQPAADIARGNKGGPRPPFTPLPGPLLLPGLPSGCRSGP